MPEPIHAVTDLSPRAISLARAIDRLQPGRYSVTLVKCEKGEAWKVAINRMEPVQVMEIRKAEG